MGFPGRGRRMGGMGFPGEGLNLQRGMRIGILIRI